MKIELLEGCSYSMEIDGTEFVELDLNKQREIAHKLVDKVSECVLQKFIEDACYTMGEYEDLGHCETCGEQNDKYIINI